MENKRHTRNGFPAQRGIASQETPCFPSDEEYCPAYKEQRPPKTTRSAAKIPKQFCNWLFNRDKPNIAGVLE